MKNYKPELIKYNGMVIGTLIKWQNNDYGYNLKRELVSHGSFIGDYKTKKQAICDCLKANKKEYKYLKSIFEVKNEKDN